MYKGQFDTDQAALAKRIAINSNDFSLEKWIFDIVQPNGDVLDLGCGTGKQTKYILKHFPECYVTAIDKSPTLLEEVESNRLWKINTDFDALNGETAQYDLILSVYSFYYSNNMPLLFETLKTKYAKKGSTILLVGPGKDNNIELMGEINKRFPDRMKLDEDFFEIEGAEYIRTYNTIHFPDDEGVWNWWKNHNTFSQDIYDAIKDEVKIRSLTKSILAIKCLVT